MKPLLRFLTVAAFAIAAQHSHAGGFVTLPTNFSPGTGSIAGSQDQDSDPMYLPHGSIAFTDSSGFLHYNLPSSFIELASNVSNIVVGSTIVGSFYDYVFRDTTTNELVFGSKVQLNPGETEFNDVFRSGFDGYTADAAWTRLTSRDLRAYLATRTSQGLRQGTLTYDPDVVAFRSDINDSEGNPWSGLYLIRTDAPSYAMVSDAIRLREGGEEGQTVLNVLLAGYAPAAAVPEPSAYLLMLAGFAILVLGVKRRSALA